MLKAGVLNLFIVYVTPGHSLLFTLVIERFDLQCFSIFFSLVTTDNLEQQYDLLVNMMDKVGPYQDLTNEGDDEEECCQNYDLTTFLEDFEEDYSVCIDESTIMEDSTDSVSTNSDLLYEGAQITCNESLLLTMAFSLRHKISMTAVADLIELLRIHCPEENSLVSNIAQFQQHFRKLKHPIKQHFCCPNVNFQVYVSSVTPPKGDTCKVCGEHLSSSAFFIEVPVEEQLSTVLSSKLHNNYFFSVVLQKTPSV